MIQLQQARMPNTLHCNPTGEENPTERDNTDSNVIHL